MKSIIIIALLATAVLGATQVKFTNEQITNQFFALKGSLESSGATIGTSKEVASPFGTDVKVTFTATKQNTAYKYTMTYSLRSADGKWKDNTYEYACSVFPVNQRVCYLRTCPLDLITPPELPVTVLECINQAEMATEIITYLIKGNTNLATNAAALNECLDTTITNRTQDPKTICFDKSIGDLDTHIAKLKADGYVLIEDPVTKKGVWTKSTITHKSEEVTLNAAVKP